MLSDSIAKAVEKADYEKMENGRFFAPIPGLKGLWAQGKTVEAALAQLDFDARILGADRIPFRRSRAASCDA